MEPFVRAWVSAWLRKDVVAQQHIVAEWLQAERAYQEQRRSA